MVEKIERYEQQMQEMKSENEGFRKEFQAIDGEVEKYKNEAKIAKKRLPEL